MNNNEEKSQSIEIDPQIAQMIELVVKTYKPVKLVKTANVGTSNYSQMRR